MNPPRVTLEQWRTLQAVVDYGGYAQAAAHLHRSQSSVSYTIHKLQEQLGMVLLEIDGRKARLNEAGEALLRRSRDLVQQATDIEALAESLLQGWEAEIRLVVDAAFPAKLLMTALKAFVPVSRGTRVQLQEVVLSGADEALSAGEADLAISASVPNGFLGEQLLEVEFIAVAHPEHPLHHLGRTIVANDLKRELQVVVRDSGMSHKKDVGWLGAEHRWTVTSIDTALTAISAGLGFGWLPCHKIEPQLAHGGLKPLALREGQGYSAPLYLVFGHPDDIGPATQTFAEILRACVQAPPEQAAQAE